MKRLSRACARLFWPVMLALACTVSTCGDWTRSRTAVAFSWAWGMAGCGATLKALHCHCGPVTPTGQSVRVVNTAFALGLLFAIAACALAKAASAASRAWLACAWFWLASWSISTLRAL